MQRALLLLLLGCRAPSAPAATPPADEIELVESWPIETPLDHSDVRDAERVWPEMIDRATKSLVFEEFYASDVEDARSESPLAPTLAAIGRAVKRGVRVRFLADQVMAPKYPATLDVLRAAGVEVRILDCKPRFGGVQHAKLFVVDEDEAFVGSQNFDWRALRHIQEIGVRVRSRAVAGGLLDVFETDWALADASTPSTTRVRAHPARPAAARFALYGSPAAWLPDPSIGDLDRLVALLDGAARSIELQVLTYSTTMRDKSTFTTLDDALRRAAARGVRVRLVVSSWADKEDNHALRALASVPNVEVRVMTIPPWSGGEIPFARVTHAKFLLLDRASAWIGTSNWEGDYFLKSRNVAIVTDAPNVVAPLSRIFDGDWAFSAALAAPPSSSDPARP
ncbi:MAG: hypothetical protein KIT84_43080 [Labilithrix sp.]|nr:hypothetical protein [Labilithrix sp.]MCW5817864.1 hypothetical protein [Labilithrix sp.]